MTTTQPGAVREHLVRALEADLIGPFEPAADGERPEEVLHLPPSRWYLTGFLAPAAGRVAAEPPDDEMGAGSDQSDLDGTSQEPKRGVHSGQGGCSGEAAETTIESPRSEMTMKALLIKKPWIDLILAGRKTWEVRGSPTKVRGPIALVESGSGTVVGVCEVVDVVGPLTLDELKRSGALHQVPAFRLGQPPRYRRPHAWVLKDARRLSQPVPYRHPQGAMIWVNLAEEEGMRVLALS